MSIGARATVLRDWDRRELLIPNRELITNQVVNLSLTDPYTRISVTAGLAYGTDTGRARAVMLEQARQTRGVVAEPPPCGPASRKR